MRPIVIGVAGGTGSGKTTVVHELVRALGGGRVSVVHHDAYYRDASHLTPAQRAAINFDHPDALETDLLVAHLDALRAGRPVEMPVYDFATHTRAAETRIIEPTRAVVVDGLLVLWDARLRERLDVKVFVDTDADVRLVRRLRRDIEDRGRSFDSVLRQYVETVRPMHLEFVEPSKRWADIILPEGGRNQVGVDMLVSKIRSDLLHADAHSTGSTQSGAS